MIYICNNNNLIMNIEKFYNEFNFAQTAEEKQVLLDEFVSVSEISDDEVKELKAQINDIIELEATANDLTISLEIEEGKYTLYSCVKSIDSYQSGCNYYIKVDDPKEFYQMTGIGETNEIIKNMIDSMRPIYYIILDDGIGTLKRKNIFPNDVDFSDYFTKFA